jgi:23S rRNA pseudouridine1911/1915/1917 synthase
VRSLTVPAGVPVRLDIFLMGVVPACSRRSAQRAIAAGQVRVNQRRARKGQIVVAGDVVEVADGLYEAGTLQPNPDLSIPVLYEDATVVAIDKPAGMPSHALRLTETATAANFLLARYPELAGIGKSPQEPGIVHRLDTDTSGVLLAARTPEAYHALRGQFSAHLVTKEYFALVNGDVSAPAAVEVRIAHDQRNRRRMLIARGAGGVPGARPAVTSYRPMERFGRCTLLNVQIRTGVRHQIRVHLASIGHPLVGDRLYAKDCTEPMASRHLLHAAGITFVHPETGISMAIGSPMPADFAAHLEALRHR